MSDNLPGLLQELYRGNVEINRRQLLRLVGLGLGGAVLAACTGYRPPPVPIPTREIFIPPQEPTQIIEELSPEPTPSGIVERFTDSALVIGHYPDGFPNISETIQEIGYKPIWIDRIPDKETLFKYPAVVYLGLPGLPGEFEGLQTHVSQKDGGAIIFAYGDSGSARFQNTMFNFSGIEYNRDTVLKFDPEKLTTSKRFITYDIREHPVTRGMLTLTIGDETPSLYLHPSCEVDPLCQGIIYGGENSYSDSGDIQNPPIVAAREYASGGRIVVGPTNNNLWYYNFGGEDNVQLIRNSLLWVLHKLP